MILHLEYFVYNYTHKNKFTSLLSLQTIVLIGVMCVAYA